MKTAFILFGIILIFVIACGRAPDACVSRCGMRLIVAGTWSCEEFQRAEDVTIGAYATSVLDPKFTNACAKLSGWEVQVMPSVTWIDDSGRDVAGETWCEGSISQVNSAPPLQGSFAHEIAHAVQGCVARVPDNDRPCPRIIGQKDTDHACWVNDGIQTAIDEVHNAGLRDRAAAAK